LWFIGCGSLEDRLWFNGRRGCGSLVEEVVVHRNRGYGSMAEEVEDGKMVLCRGGYFLLPYNE
jgi:hypothetical protein